MIRTSRIALAIGAFSLLPLTAHAKFLSADPVGFVEGGVDHFNRYVYAVNDPINAFDPDGRDSCSGANLGDCNMKNIAISTEVSTTTNSNGSATDTRQQVERNRVTDTTTTADIGSITRLPQNSNNGAPAVVEEDMQSALLDFSEEQGVNIEVTSGVRTPEQNRRVGGTPRSNHLNTNNLQAADIRISGQSAAQTADQAVSSGSFNRVNEYNRNAPAYRGGSGVHVDLKSTGNQGRFTNWIHEPR